LGSSTVTAISRRKSRTERRLRHAPNGRDAPVDDGQFAVRQQTAEVALTEHPPSTPCAFLDFSSA
jgi:hypothetical protein